MHEASHICGNSRQAGLALLIACALPGTPLQAQVRTERGPLAVTVEGYANVSAATGDLESSRGDLDDALRIDAALRGLALLDLESGPELGVRLVVEAATDGGAELAESSVLLVARQGRFEIGERQGLPDVLVGYAPNNFTFTGAEFGPASGPSLDPGGGLQSAFLDDMLQAGLRELGSLGFAATLADDRSAKALYVSPKRGGWLAGVSYSPDATDPRYDRLLQAGLTHDRYWGEHALHVGGSYSYAGAASPQQRDLHSVSAGATLVLHYDWMLGMSLTYDGRSGLPVTGSGAAPADAAWGAVASLNYNRGPWTAGAFVQHGTREGDPQRRGDDDMTAFEAGLSYRTSTRLRVYLAWYRFEFDDEGGVARADRHRGDLLIAGLRATL